MANSESDQKKSSPTVSLGISEEERSQKVREAAYFIAEQRRFKGDCCLSDWLEAVAKIDRIYGKAEPNE